ncbi:unnamed protein product [Aphanomyces euteiches]|uniref:ZNF380 coiled-coil domain-containing protein n=1 Tax=Aphanomyces euteiches TaxID=100861 RepID=A0A6G0X354_9STRA|nr:hypothetical protein Ae201684_008943 [Aphanomyces euteiches]KAH9054411.1 hypothetical protein Ae201684P_018132 [Aphanomyces euteiches]KAH9145675.1 hypothetical protein AeRB84_010438 [Aphanomyces euteiches]
MSKRKEEHLPAGFFDDPLADAKARKINIKEEVAKVQEKEWKEFQNFVAAVESEETSEEKAKAVADEALEGEAREKLQQMQYLNRVRKTLLAVDHAGEDVAEEETAELLQTEETDSASDIVAQAIKKRSEEQMRRQEVEAEDDDEDDLDWRARRR